MRTLSGIPKSGLCGFWRGAASGVESLADLAIEKIETKKPDPW
jgi:hypothetical protein